MYCTLAHQLEPIEECQSHNNFLTCVKHIWNKILLHNQSSFDRNSLSNGALIPCLKFSWILSKVQETVCLQLIMYKYCTKLSTVILAPEIIIIIITVLLCCFPDTISCHIHPFQLYTMAIFSYHTTLCPKGANQSKNKNNISSEDAGWSE